MIRLLNTASLQLEVHVGSDVPKYAILSHTWEREEVTFHDITADNARARQMSGFTKIEGTCTLAASQGYRYVWIDTCCIDKSSSAELTEAINSMYAWYKDAAVCYVYLSDVTNADEVERSRWFTRGWTLQELLAPREVNFYSRDWDLLGQKKDRGFLEMLSRVTDIEQGVLGHYIKLDNICVARRMYWASKRQTTRIEDEAYCLMGIFEVNMPLIYGEGTRAFQRLQEAIISSRPFDQSILAWYNMIPRGDRPHEFDILASRPACFSLSGDIVSPGQYYNLGSYLYPFSTDGMHITGTKLELPGMLHFFARRVTEDEDEGVDCGIRHLVPKPPKEDASRLRTNPNCYLVLDCQVGLDPGTAPVIVLCGNGVESHTYSRVERQRVPRTIYRFQMNEPGHMEGEIVGHRIAASPEQSDKAIGRCAEHLVTKKISLQRHFRLTYDQDQIFSKGLLEAGAIYPFTMWVIPSQPRTIPVRMSVSSVFPPERWDNKLLCLPTSLPVNWETYPAKGFSVLGAVSLRLEGTITDDMYLSIHHVIVIFGGYRIKGPMYLWCRLVGPSEEDLEGCKTDTDCLARFWKRDLTYYQASAELLPKSSLEVGPKVVLKADLGGYSISMTLRNMLRLWMEDIPSDAGPGQIKEEVEVPEDT